MERLAIPEAIAEKAIEMTKSSSDTTNDPETSRNQHLNRAALIEIMVRIADLLYGEDCKSDAESELSNYNDASKSFQVNT